MTDPEKEKQPYSPTMLEQIYRRNFAAFVTDAVLFTLAMGIIGTTTVIPDFVRRLTDSEILIGLSGNLFTIGYTLPQLFVARYIVQWARKKWLFVGANIPTRFMMLIFAATLAWLGKDRPLLILAVFFGAYSLTAFGDGLVGIPWADLIGNSLNEKWRARMFGVSTAITGLLMLIAAPIIGRVLGENGPPFPQNYAYIFGAGGIVFALSILPAIFIHELPGGKVVEKLPPFRDFVASWGQVLRQDTPFRMFIITSILTSLFMMSAPFYIGYATKDLGLSSDVAVPILLAMQTVGGVLGAFLYAWVGAKNNALYIQISLISAVLLPICALLAGLIGPFVLYLGFFGSGLAIGGNLFSAYMNWIISYADAEQRPLYVGLSNTTTAVISLVTPPNQWHHRTKLRLPPPIYNRHDHGPHSPLHRPLLPHPSHEQHNTPQRNRSLTATIQATRQALLSL